MSEATNTLARTTREINFSDKDIERFWRGVDKNGPNGCWIWKGARISTGYGAIRSKKDTWMTHRVAWTITNGPIPKGKVACHKCDNPICCNPDHLFIGTAMDNVKDMTSKGRRNDLKGEDHSKAILTAQTVRLIRFVYGNGGYTQKRLGEIFGVTKPTIQCIVENRTWRHIL
jgi:hypothetical protein